MGILCPTVEFDLSWGPVTSTSSSSKNIPPSAASNFVLAPDFWKLYYDSPAEFCHKIHIATFPITNNLNKVCQIVRPK